MESLFITYEIAVKLKELGFNEACMAFHTENPKYIGNKIQLCITDARHGESPNAISFKQDFLLSQEYLAPLIDQVVLWLNNEYGLFITFEDDRHTEPTDKLPYGYRFYVSQYGHCVIGRNKYYNTYEEARENAIRMCIGYIIDVINKE